MVARNISRIIERAGIPSKAIPFLATKPAVFSRIAVNDGLARYHEHCDRKVQVYRAKMPRNQIKNHGSRATHF